MSLPIKNPFNNILSTTWQFDEFLAFFSYILVVWMSPLYGCTFDWCQSVWLCKGQSINCWWLRVPTVKLSETESILAPSALDIFDVLLKVSTFQNEFMKSSFISPKIWTKNCKDFCPVVLRSTGQKSFQYLVHKTMTS